MIGIKELSEYINKLLNVNNYEDFCPNGLQVAGKEEIRKVVTAVSVCQELLQKAVAEQADAVLVHHGFFWRGEDPALVAVKRARVAVLLQNNINLLTYHLPLDYHLSYGNNVQLAKRLAIKVEANEPPIYSGEFAASFTVAEFEHYLAERLQQQPLSIVAGNHAIKKLAWCSGGGADYIELAAQRGVDGYLTGEINERSVYLARELGVHLIVAGHYATERYGVQALGKHLQHKFSIKHQFVELDNPV